MNKKLVVLVSLLFIIKVTSGAETIIIGPRDIIIQRDIKPNQSVRFALLSDHLLSQKIQRLPRGENFLGFVYIPENLLIKEKICIFFSRGEIKIPSALKSFFASKAHLESLIETVKEAIRTKKAAKINRQKSAK